MPPKSKQGTAKIAVGWREWISLPSLHIKKIKVKIDTGARTSALHASNLEFFKKGSHEFVKFTVHPFQKSLEDEQIVSASLVEHREIRSSIGLTTLRPVISVPVIVGPYEFETEITLVNRDLMGFRMLLGRQALRARFLVDPGKSFLLEKSGWKI